MARSLERSLYTRRVEFTLPDRDRLSLQADIQITETQATKPISLSANPIVDSQYNKIVLQDVEYANDNSNNLTLAKALINSIQEILNLSNFELQGIDLPINRIKVTPGKIIVAGSALVQDFPSQ